MLMNFAVVIIIAYGVGRWDGHRKAEKKNANNL